jgi:hypothetical protein
MYMTNLVRVFPGTTVYNLSDGTRIGGTIPRLPRTVTLKGDAAIKARDLQLVANTLEEGDHYKGFDVEELERLRGATDRVIDDIANLFRDIRDPVELFDAIKDLFMVLEEGATDRTVYAFLWGTTLMFYQYLYVTVRRLPEEAREDFMDQACTLSAEEIDRMRADFEALIDQLVSEL